jgi:uncharacterized phiE125 gp8 family phage protein
VRSIATVTSAATVTKLTTLERVKAELNITSSASDDLLNAKINEATSDIEAHTSRTFRRETFSEVFWGDAANAEFLVLARAPVSSLATVVGDDASIASTEYRLDADAGMLFRLDASGYPCGWSWGKSVVLTYTAGFALPGESGRDLPPTIESAAIDLVTSYWVNRGRDHTIKSEDVPGLGSVTYWVGAVGESGELPPDVMAKILPFRRVLV